MPVHVYGRPCDVAAIESIADIYGLKLIYDAAHAFAVNYQGESLLKHGDLSVLSFHATKVFSTFEGGAIICPDAKTKQRIDFLKNFGFANEETVVAPGINGKMNEFQAALGLLQLKHVDRAIARRCQIDTLYRQGLEEVQGIRLLAPPVTDKSNYAYFPILVEKEYPLSRDALYQKLKDSDIYARRYFYPLVSAFPMYRGLSSAAKANLPVANSISDKVICLPIYPDLRNEQIDLIISLLSAHNQSLRHAKI
jgi:dTDP-4-amino-4,6-dideoxygalactose transaminase